MESTTIPLELVLGIGGLPLVIGATELVKRTFPDLQARWWPAVSLAWALALNTGVGVYMGNDPVLAGVTGFVAGLAASGLWSAGKTMTEKPTNLGG